MTLYTIMPLETVFEQMHNGNEAERPVQIWWNGIHMEVEPIAPGMGKIVRLLQCQLDDYLNPGLFPGTVVMFGSHQSAQG
ncbi:YlzJ-like family protein [Paenibacillus sp. NEAU-GSW1]|uniref:YlzJ-like family protein n=1 Tax=Paenibacillus sp. NEAU-GSW1 TaxID=2682486 RepID=UPI0012E2BAC1|nr:YlzJ-like family protein [Paenibacillus sp. NEAU-GSW1]MUT66413.1 hypothetical protein [Paenibacillus sp. NEAU-GSW1]